MRIRSAGRSGGANADSLSPQGPRFRLLGDPARVAGTPLHRAAEKGCVDAVAFLLDAGASKTASDSGGHSPLHLAAEKGHSRCVSLLVKRGLDPRARNNEGQTVLHLCAGGFGTAQCVSTLIAAGAEIDAKDEVCAFVSFQLISTRRRTTIS